ncbi:MAG: hypothetical protein FWD98_06745, partial [Defluviitaleaceae bacterium]|nr:hypothetical protein [Defluviitaleaceae bacterium]
MQHTEATSILKEYYEGKELTGEVRVYEDKVNKLMKLPTDQLRMHVEKIGTAVRVLKELDSPSIGTNNNLSAGIIVLDRLRDALNKHPDVIRKKAEENRIREEENRKAEEEKKRTALELQRKYK